MIFLRTLTLSLFGLVLAAPAFAADTQSTDTAEPAAAAPSLDQARERIAAKDFAAAIPLLASFTQTDPNSADGWNLLGFALRKTGDLAGAATAYQKALALDADHLGALEYQGELFVMTGDMNGAKQNLARLQTLCGTCEEAADLEQAITGAGG